MSGSPAHLPRSRRWFATALIVALPLVGAACGGSEEVVAFSGSPQPPTPPKNLVESLAADPDARFDTLIALVTAHDEVPGARVKLAEVLTGKGPLTVFAPTDDAFDKALTPATLTALNVRETKGEKGELAFEVTGDPDKLAAVLAAHVVAQDVAFETPPWVIEGKIDGRTPIDKAGMVIVDDGEVTVESVGVDNTPITSRDLVVGGDTVELGKSKATIVDKDVKVPNGFVQVIDTVLIPA